MELRLLRDVVCLQDEDAKNLISKVVPVLKVDGQWVRNPMIITDKYVEDGEIVYGEYKTGDELKEARGFVKEHQANADFELLDKEVDKIVLDLCQSLSRLPDQVHRQYSAEEEILLGYCQELQPALAGSQHER